MSFWKKLKNAVTTTDKVKNDLQVIGVPVPAKVSAGISAANYIAALFKKKDK
jgi:hypothetical protein